MEETSRYFSDVFSASRARSAAGLHVFDFLLGRNFISNSRFPKKFRQFIKYRGRHTAPEIFALRQIALGPNSILIDSDLISTHNFIKIANRIDAAFDYKGAIALTALIEASQLIITLDIISNSIRDECAEKLFESLPLSQSLFQPTNLCR
jgi:hypothetical protein